MMMESAYQIVLYDGSCSFCSFWVRFIRQRDREGRFRFAAYQSQTGRELCLARGLDPEKQESLGLIGPDGLQRKTDAVLAILEQLGGLWRLAGLFRVVPRSWRDALYDFVARNRHLWFRRATATPPDDPRFLP